MCLKCRDKVGYGLSDCKCPCSKLEVVNIQQHIAITEPNRGIFAGTPFDIIPTAGFGKIETKYCEECKHHHLDLVISSLGANIGFLFIPSFRPSVMQTKEQIEKQKKERAEEDRREKSILLKEFIKNGGKNLSKNEIKTLKILNQINPIKFSASDEKIITKLINEGYIRKEGLFLKKYIIEKKGYAILNWINLKEGKYNL